MKLWALFVAGAAVSWGLYVPVLHEGQKQLGSSLRAFLCVGIAYFLLAVLVPAGVMARRSETGSFTMSGSLLATAAGVVAPAADKGPQPLR